MRECVCVNVCVCVRERVQNSGKLKERQCLEADVKNRHGDLVVMLSLSRRSPRLEQTGWSHTENYFREHVRHLYVSHSYSIWCSRFPLSEPSLLVDRLSTKTCSSAVHEAKASSDVKKKTQLQMKRFFGKFV